MVADSPSDNLIQTKKTIAVIGAGNVGFSLSNYFIEHHFDLIQVVDHNLDRLEPFIKSGISVSTNIEDLSPKVDIIIIAVHDEGIPSVVEKLSGVHSVVVHTSGSVAMSVFNNKNIKRFGVLYPLQTFTIGQAVSWESVSFFIEGVNDDVLSEIKGFVEKISSNVFLADSDKRKSLHLAAVFACNFTNHMYFCAEKILNEINLPIDVMKPLIRMTTDKFCEIGAIKAQTGPAKRNDRKIIEEHLNLLEDKPNLLNIYKVITENIYKTSLDDKL